MYTCTITSIAPALIIIALIALAALFFYLGTKFSSGRVHTPDIKEKKSQIREEEGKLEEERKLVLKREKREEKRKRMLSGEWGAKTLTQKACLEEVRQKIGFLHSKVGGDDERERYKCWDLEENISYLVKELEYMKTEIERLGLDSNLSLAVAKLIAEELAERRFYEAAKVVAERFSL